MLTVARREVKLGFRNAWTYSFLLLLSIFVTAIFLLQAGIPATEGYTDLTGTIMNMTLYLLPLITLLLGGVSVTGEKENGHWGLLATYPLTSYSLLWGKFFGLGIVLLTIIFFSFGFAGVIATLFSRPLSFSTLLFFTLFSSFLSLVYLSIALFIGTLANNRWQALIGSIAVWFVTILIWPLLVISILSHLPSFKLVQPWLEVLTILNPAELIRVFSIMRLGSGSAFGASYDTWISWATSSFGLLLFIGIWLVWMIAPILCSGMIWKRRDKYGTE